VSAEGCCSGLIGGLEWGATRRPLRRDGQGEARALSGARMAVRIRAAFEPTRPSRARRWLACRSAHTSAATC
jgi:hypothetical protein